jgi:hypothetical protein
VRLWLTAQVSAAEFEGYYSAISAAVPDDAYFELIIFGSWPGTGACAAPWPYLHTLLAPAHGCVMCVSPVVDSRCWSSWEGGGG